MKKADIFEHCPHLKSEWLPIPSPQNEKYYQNAYSDDQCEAKYLKTIPMKEVDIYSSRQAYSFPFCPRVYKYVIEQNYQLGNQLSCDLLLLSERVNNHLCEDFLLKATNQQIQFLASKAHEIAKGFSYLYKKFGAFQITQKMIGWTELGIIKVWFNEDFALNKKASANCSQQLMLASLIKILNQNIMIKYGAFKKCTTFQSLIDCLQNPQHKKQQQMMKHVAFRPLQNLNSTVSSINYHFNLPKKELDKQERQSKSRKNITFSYSNKDLNNRLINEALLAGKKTSIHLNHQQHNKLLNQLAQLSKESLGINKSPSASLKTICGSERKPERKPSRKRVSYFNLQNIQQKLFPSNQLKVNKHEDNYSKTTVSYRNCNFQSYSEAVSKHHNRIRPQMLHYSTSSNPISKFINISRAQNKAYSTIGSTFNEDILQNTKRGSCEKNISQTSEKSGLEQKIQESFEGPPLKIEQKEEQTNLRQSQQIQKDLDALFHSNHSFDYNQLENELDCIL